MEHDSNEKPSQGLPPPSLGTYIALASRIGWGLVVLFGMVGILAGKEMGVFVIMIAATVWVAMKILDEALVCLRMLQFIISASKTKDDDSPPADPPSSGGLGT